MKRTRIKFCGLQSIEDAQSCVALGIDAVGCIFAPSPRRIDLATAVQIAAHLPPLVTLVGVFVNHDEADFAAIRARLPHMVPQFCGDESPEDCERLAGGSPYLKVMHVADTSSAKPVSVEAYRGMPVFDTFAQGMSGGTGQTFAWSSLSRPQKPFMVAGGLTPENVATAISALRPFGVDVRSGIEIAGQKNLQRMRAFVEAVRRVDDEQSRV